MDALATSFTEFFERAFTLPTAVWSVLLILVAAYWTLSLLTGADAEALDGMDGALDGGLDGGLDGALDGGLDAGVDHALDGGLDGAFEGGAEHALHGTLDGGLDHALDRLDGHESMSGPRSQGLFGWLGFHDVPKTFSLTLVVVFGWLVSYFGAAWVVDAGKWAAFGLGTALVLGLASLTVAVGLTAVALLPLRSLLVLREGPSRMDLLGETCTIKTGRVDERFGQAETRGGQLVQVRARDGRPYRYGETAVIFDYDRDHEVFYIAPLDAALTPETQIRSARGVPDRSTE